MARSPYEKFNVFDPLVQKELRDRRKSTNLLEVRTPFLRYTSTVEFPTADWYAELQKMGTGATEAWNYLAPFELGRYNGCKFFTLGLHGFEDEKYDKADLYGTRMDTGLVVGTTYRQADENKEGEQILVRTYDKQVQSTFGTLESPRGFPPPGLESATVERLRNGNVLKFTINAVCYTRHQLEMLDLLAFSPGMTCVLEWGNVISTPYGQKGLIKENILDFKKTTLAERKLKEILEWHKGGIRRQNITKGARTKFIEEYCAKNNFHYDFAVARIANVKTSLENDKYKITAIAYGVADNIMYISAYATNNPDVQEDENKTKEQQLLTSVREYFTPKSKFTVLLDSMVDDPEIVKFDEPDDAQNKAGLGAPAGSGTATNDLGQEQTFYITLNKFIKFFLNDPVNGIAAILNRATNITDETKSSSLEIIDDLMDDVEGVLRVGYNEVLRSTDPSTVLIVNTKAMEQSSGMGNARLSIFRESSKITPTGQQRLAASEQKLKINTLTQIGADGNPSYDGNPAGVASAASGIWLNSKLIQSVFLEARTVHEGIETMLNKINAATEGYWDLMLAWDEQKNNFRIVDGNVKMPPTAANDVIYTFNKDLPNNPQGSTSIDGSEVLDIKINADYPKLLVSQLGISAINNSSGSPNRRDLQFGRSPLMGPRLFDLLRKDQPAPPPPTSNAPTIPNTTATTLNKFVDVALKSSLYDQLSARDSIRQYLGSAGFDTLPQIVQQTLQQIFLIQRPLQPFESQAFAAQISSVDLTNQQLDAIKAALSLRLKAIVTVAKDKELTSFTGPGGTGGVDNVLAIRTKADIADQLKQIRQNIQQSKTDLLQLINSKVVITTTVQTNNVSPSGSPTPSASTPSQNVVGGIGR